MKPFTVSVVVPVYNSEQTLAELVDRLQKVLRTQANAYEIILLNDGSHDRSWQIITELAARYPVVHGLNMMRNYGQENVLLAGIKRARYEVIVTLDDDLQHPPEEIPKLLSKLNEGYDVVYGKPVQREHHIWRNATSRLLKVILHIVLGADMANHIDSFRAFRSVLRQGFENFTDASPATDVLLSWSANRVTYVPIDHQERRVGKSGYTLAKLISLSLSMMTGYSILPLRIASGIGLATSVLGMFMFFYVVMNRLLNPDDVPGFAFTASEIALLAGLQLFATGVIGEYIARLHFRTMGKPPYVIREEINGDFMTMEEMISDVPSPRIMSNTLTTLELTTETSKKVHV
jgi:undecaprenyl-phosphate 4-deoxy-4-formamido-L-arabinose transferase